MTKRDQIVCITQYRSLIFDSELKLKSVKPIVDSKMEFIQGVQNFEVALSHFLISCQVTDAILDEDIDNVAELGLEN